MTVHPNGFLKMEAMLGLQRPWTERELRRQHRVFVTTWHPDRCHHPDANVRLALANDARDQLLAWVQSVPGGKVQPEKRTTSHPQSQARTRRSASPGWEDKRPKDGALWWSQTVSPHARLPPGWQRARAGRRPGQPWTKKSGVARELIHELEQWMSQQRT